MSAFTKRNDRAPTGFFEAEAAGLAWLASARGARTVGVLAVEPGRIELERVEQVRPTADHARAFGSALARTHSAGAPAFGSSPEGWRGPLFIGSRPMASATEESWGRFYARDRVLPFLEIAEKAVNIGAGGAVAVREACEAIAAGTFDDGAPAARIHGDLWAGNVLWGEQGVVLIDPAAHGGHRETDLAMLALFGCPFLDDVLDGYHDVVPLSDNWQQRVPLHQLHPLAVHAAGHGPQYGAALERAARHVLSLA